MKGTFIYLILILSFITFSCSTVSYTPTVALDVSPITIQKSLSVEKFIDKSPTKDRKNPFAGFSVTNKKALTGDLATEVTNAIVMDFSINSVFKNVSRKVDNPDYILKGEIVKYKGQSRLTNYGIVSFATIVGIYTWFFGLPVQKGVTDVEINIYIYNSEGTLIGSYFGNCEDKDRASMYRDKTLAVLNQTNRSLSCVVSQIREQILADIKRYENDK